MDNSGTGLTSPRRFVLSTARRTGTTLHQKGTWNLARRVLVVCNAVRPKKVNQPAPDVASPTRASQSRRFAAALCKIKFQALSPGRVAWELLYLSAAWQRGKPCLD